MWKKKERALKERRSSYPKEGGDGNRTSEDSAEGRPISKKLTMIDGKKSFGPTDAANDSEEHDHKYCSREPGGGELNQGLLALVRKFQAETDLVKAQTQAYKTEVQMRRLECEKLKIETEKLKMELHQLKRNELMREKVEAEKKDEEIPYSQASPLQQELITMTVKACEKNDLDAIQHWLKIGVKINCKNSTGFTPLARASYYGNLDAVECLVRLKADVNCRTQYGRGPLSYAAGEERSTPILKFLCEKCDVDIEAVDNFGSTALIRATRNGRLHSVRYLTEEANANVRHVGAYGKTARMWARSLKNKAISQFLAKFEFEPILRRDISKLNFLYKEILIAAS